MCLILKIIKMNLKEEINVSIKAIKTTRKGLRINQIEYAKICNISASSVKKIELLKCDNLGLIEKYLDGFKKKDNNPK